MLVIKSHSSQKIQGTAQNSKELDALADEVLRRYICFKRRHMRYKKDIWMLVSIYLLGCYDMSGRYI
jgi:hypothetical protein